LPYVDIKGLLSDEVEDAHLGKAILRTQDPAFALLHVTGAPRRVEVMQRTQALLHVSSRSRLFGACDHHPYLSCIGVGEGPGFLNVCLEVMNKGDFLCGNVTLD